MRQVAPGPCAALVIVMLVGLAAGLVAAEETQESKPKAVAADALDWLAGTWRSASPGSMWDEHWTPPRGGSLVAVTRWVQDGKPVLYELTAIETGPAGLELRLRHFGPHLDAWEKKGPRIWKLARTAERRAAFENADAGFPQRVIYHRVADDTLEVNLEGMGDDAGKKNGFRFTRAP